MLYVSLLKKSTGQLLIFLSFLTPIFTDLTLAASVTNEASQHKHKIISKYEKWKTAVDNPENSQNVFSFFYNNPHWPLYDQSVKVAEKYASKAPKNMVLKWFKRYSPKTKEGIETYIKLLLETSPEIADDYIKQTWIFQNFSSEFMEKYKQEFSDYVSPIEDARKAKQLMNGLKTKQLDTLKEIVIDEIADFISDFLEKHLIKKSGGHTKKELSDIDRKYTIVQNLIDQKQDNKAANILSISNENEERYATSFFNQRRHVAFNILRSGNPQLAYKVMKMYKLNSEKQDEKIAKAEWLLGYISFRFLNNLKNATSHFKTAYENSSNAIRLSRNAFWLAEVYRQRKDIVPAIDWYTKASKYFSTFYGYLARQKLKELHISDQVTEAIHTPPVFGTAFTFYNRELVQVLSTITDKNMRKYFYQQLIHEIDNPDEEMLLMDIAIANNEVDILISENSKRQRYFSNDSAYKILNDNDMKYVKKINSDPCFVSFVHSIIQRESNFNEKAKSRAGAIGLMQIMPSTANYEAKRMKFYVGGSLFSKKKNITIGASILNRLLTKYSGNIVYAAAAYNCGEGGLSKYLKSIKNLKRLDVLDIIELIPIKETRLYVKHVVRAFFTYQKKFFTDSCYNCKAILGTKKSA